MGYGMETVRTRIGGWVLRNQSAPCNQSDHGSEKEFCPLIEGLEDVSIELGQEVSQVLLEDLKTTNLRRRGIQTRVLWEVQQELAKPDDVGPGSANLILLCILSFPSICIELEKGDMENVTSETEKGSVLVNVRGLPRMRMYAKGGPQEIDVIGMFSENGEGLNVKLHLRVSEEVKRFKWVLWRDAFLGRLKGLKEWQEEHGIQSTELHLTDDEMKSELKMMKTSAGEKVVCWPGWKPFRFEMMRFELESEGLLKEQFEEERKDADHVLQSASALVTQDRKDGEGRLLAWQGKLSLYLCIDSIPRMEVKAVAYTEASSAVLKQAFLVVEKAFDVGGTGGRVKMEIDRSKVLLEDAKNCLVNDWERAVSLLEIAATVDGNEEALGECVNVLMAQGNKRDSGWPVVCLLERFLAQMYSDGKRKTEIE